jgi:hypothetical protein
MSQTLTDDLFEQVEQLERSSRRWRLVALIALVGFVMALFFSVVLLGIWFTIHPQHRDEFIDMQMQFNMERAEHAAQQQEMQLRLQNVEADLKETQRALEEARKKAVPEKAP